MIVPRLRQRLGAIVPCALGAIALACAAEPARAANGSAAADRAAWVSIGALSGSAMPDAALANYQWTTLPRAAWGAQALAGRGPLAAGLRLWRTQTRQENVLPGGTLTSTVHLTSVEAVGRVRMWRVLGTDVLGSTGVGWLRIGWDPNRLEIDTGGGAPIEVRFEPVNEWIAGAGLAFSRPVAAGWSAGLELDRRVFRMDTAHRNGSTIEYRRGTFGDWNARFALAWQYAIR